MFGSLAVASMLVMGGVSVASASNADYFEQVKAITTWTDGAATDVTKGGTMDHLFFGGSLAENGKKVSVANTSLTLSSGTLHGELNAGGAAVGAGAESKVMGTATINISGGQLLSPGEAHPDYEDYYSPIRGGGVAMDGGSAYVEKAVLNLTGGDVTQWNPDYNSSYGTTEIMGGGCVVGSGSSVTKEVEINIGKDFSLGKMYDAEGGGYYGNGVSVYGGGDGDTVGKTTINVDAASFNDALAFSMFGGGMASDGVDSTVGEAVINITGDSSVIGEGYGYIFGGGSASNGCSANVEKVSININGGYFYGQEISGGGSVAYDDYSEAPYGGTANTGTSTINVENGKFVGTWFMGGGMNFANQEYPDPDADPSAFKIGITNTETATINIKGGDFSDARIVGGAFSNSLSGANEANVETTNINISGGKFSSHTYTESSGYVSPALIVAGGGEGNNAKVTTSNINISGGSFEKIIIRDGVQGIHVYGGGINTYGFDAPEEDLPVAVTTNTNINISGVNMAGADIFGGGRGLTKTENAKVKITDAVVHNVYGGGNAQEEWSYFSGVAEVANASVTVAGNSKVNTVAGAYLVSGNTSENTQMTTLDITIEGGNIGRVWAAEIMDDDASMNIQKATFNIKGGNIEGSVIAGGKVRDTNSAGEANSNPGNIAIAEDVVINLSGGSIAQNVQAITKGSAVVTVDTANFQMGGVVNAESTGTASLNFTEKVTSFDGAKFIGFDELNVSGVTTITGGFIDTNIGKGLSLNGNGEVIANVNMVEPVGTLTVAKGVLAAETIELGENVSLVVDGGSLKTASAQVFTAGLGDGTVADPSSVKNGLSFTKGDLTLTDGWYNLGYVSKAEDLIGDATTLTLLGELKNAGNLVIGKDDGDHSASVEGVASSLGSITIDGDGDSVIVNNQQEVTILGDISTTSGKDAHLVVGGTTTGSATVNLGDADKVENSGGSISGKASVAADSKLNVNGGSFGIGEVALEGSAELNVKAELSTDKISAASGSTIEVSGKLNVGEMELEGKASINGETIVEKLTAAADAIINVGSDAAAGVLSAVESALKGGRLFLDPSWIGDGTDTVEMASKAALGTGADVMSVDGQITVGRNSVLTLGTEDTTWAENVFNASGLSWGNGADEISAAVALAKPISVSAANGGSLRVNGSLTSASFAPVNTVEFAANSLLLVDGTVAKAGAIKGDGATALTVDASSKLYIQNANAGEYNFATGLADTSTLGGWESIATNARVEASAELVGCNIVVTATSKAIEETYPDIIAVNAINGMKVDTSASDMGVQFLSKAIDDPTQSLDVEGLVNEVSRGAVTAGVQNTALRIADAASNTVLEHMSLSGHTASVYSDGVDFWAAPLYGNLYTSGMVADGASVRGQFGGLALGADMEIGQLFGGKVRAGLAINGGGGQSESKGTSVSAQNDYGFGGVSLYAGWNKEALNIIGSIGYAFGDNDVEMGLPVNMNTAKANVDTGAFTTDLRAEYQLKTDWLDIMPHAGIRYTALHTDAHDFKVGGKKLNRLDSDTQHIVQFPVGVTLSKDFDLKGWNVKPMADMSVIPAAGDKETSGKVRFSGVDAVDSFDARIMDSTSWAGTVGIQAAKGNFSLGLNYGVQASSHETDQNVQLKLGWKF